MNCNVKIKKIGTSRGTVGWLVDGLRSGKLIIEEGRQRDNGNHGLYLEGDGLSVFLAGRNQFGVSETDYPGACDDMLYKPAVKEFRNADFTDACWGSLLDLSQTWCDEMNEAIDNEPKVTIGIKRIEIANGHQS